ncbi:MAG: GNAT family N-acetyltransferase [Gemmobacter sp.]
MLDPRRPVPGWVPPPLPVGRLLRGRQVSVEPLDPARHVGDLWSGVRGHPAMWDFMGYGPFAEATDYAALLARLAGAAELVAVAILGPAGRARGVATWLRIDPPAGSVEIGHIHLAPAFQRTTAATEALSLMIGHCFDLGYRRVEWKCDAANLASRRAAERLGFSHEGVFRNAAVVKGRNRDTAWFAIIAEDWPALRAAHAAWLAPPNFDGEGRQRQSLSGLTAPLLFSRDPALQRAP